MDIRNCRKCGRMYAYTSGLQICDQCKQQDEDDFQKVRKYIYDHSGTSMKEVAEACDVSVEKITRYLKEGRLEIRDGTNILLQCESCGQSIKSGRFCKECSKKLERELTRASTSESSSNSEHNKKDDESSKHAGGLRYLKS